jgi:D-alanine-D-alanine ligase
MIAILSGGTSAERDVALRSSEIFLRNLPDADFFVFPEELPAFLGKYRQYSLVIPVFHGTYGEDGQIFAFLKTLGVKTAFSPFEVHAVAIDKFVTGNLLAPIVPVPESILIRKWDAVPEISPEKFPLVVKPNR